jgi:hypothetical protein
MSNSRKIQKVKTRRNPITGQIEKLGGSYESHRIVEETDDFESLYVNEEVSNNCGCLTPAAGQCGRCGSISCQRCFTHCGGTDNPSPLGCGIPLCRSCAKYLQLSESQTLPLCGQCYGNIKRKSFWIDVKKLLAAPIVEFEDKQDD